MSDKHPANEYAEQVVAGLIPACQFVHYACKRHLADLERSTKKGGRFPYRFDEDAANKILNFAEMLPHVKGKWARGGQTIKLELWQKFILSSIFGWLHKKTGLRRFREAYIEVCRKNGKSILAAIIGLYMLTMDDEPGSEVYCGAGSEKQAWEVFRPAKLMAEKAEGFADELGVGCNASNLHVISTGSRFEPVIGDPGDGPSPHCAIVDEFHEHKSPAQYDTFTTGMGAREHPLLLVITTAGNNLAGPCYDNRSQVAKVLHGVLKNETLFGIIYTLDKDDDWTDFEVWKKANPNYGVSVFEDYLRKQHRTAMQRAAKQNSIRCKHLNQWVNAGVAFLDMPSWEKSESPLTLEDFEGEECWVGVDLGAKLDLAAVVLLFKREANFHAFPFLYLPEVQTEGDDRAHYAGWAKDGHIRLTPGVRIDFDSIEEDIVGNKEEGIVGLAHRFEIQAIAFDPWEATQFCKHLMNQGLPMVEVPQTVNHLSEPLKELEAILIDGTFRHDGNPVLAWMASNICAKVDKKDNVFPYKEHFDNKIDGIIALILALKMATSEAASAKSVYEERGVRCL